LADSPPTAEISQFIATQDSVLLATANSLGQPYIQHRGSPPGFLRDLPYSAALA
jgi:uncharacterized protein